MRTRRVLLAALLVVTMVAASAGLAVAKAGGGEPTRVTVSFKKFRFIGLKKNYEPGTYTFTFRNTGQFPA